VDDTRREYSQGRLAELTEQLRTLTPLLEGHSLCVYATGSYGRLEAWKGSDVDVFFLYDVAEEGKRFPWTMFLRVAARLIDVTEQMEFPPFSGDGRYLEVLYVDEMERVLGSRQDDSLNAFTARMLLLLESQPLYDDGLYESLLRRIIGFYYRDFEDHAESFLPVFLINDVLRFWRTLTLNYEHHRLKLLEVVGAERERQKAASALKNYKLKVSRAATCFSMIANLSVEEPPVDRAAVFALCRMTPAERFERLRARNREAGGIIDELDEVYGAFLESVQKDEKALLEEFADHDSRTAALGRATRYGNLIFKLLSALVSEDRMRYLVI
jgi:predicted nucleotidyltransferase